MRSIQVSTDVFAAIWSARQTGEATEDAILRRVFTVQTPVAEGNSNPDMHTVIGFHDPRYGVIIPPGFEIFRVYLGKEYRAQAMQGFWILAQTGIGYPTLNELSTAIGAGHENAWGAWFYQDGKRRRPVSDLRDPTKISRRKIAVSP